MAPAPNTPDCGNPSQSISEVRGDIVVQDNIGGGGAGIPAAIEVANAGGKAVVLEQADSLGGTAAISGGGCFIVGTPLQEAQGIKDTPDLAFEDWVKWGQGAADERWARFYIEHAGGDFGAYLDEHDAYARSLEALRRSLEKRTSRAK